MIKELKAGNFKSWKDTGNLVFSKLTAFFGTNSSGKTSLLQLLLLMKQTAESSDRQQVFDFGSPASYVELGTFKDVVHNHDLYSEMSFSINWSSLAGLKVVDSDKPGTTLFNTKDFNFNCIVKQNGSGRIYVSELSYTAEKYRFTIKAQSGKDPHKHFKLLSPQFKLTRTQGRAWELQQPIKFYGFPDQVRAYYQNAYFLQDLQYKFEELFGNIYYLGPLREYPQREYKWSGTQPTDMGRKGEKVINAMLASRGNGELISLGRGRGKQKRSLEEHVAFWLKELGLIDSFNVKPISKDETLFGVFVKKNEHSPEVLITDVGFGVSQILPVITLCFYAPKGSILVIEQPEIHLHPGAQAGLADVFIDAIEKRGVQIILESHSEHLLRRLQRRIAENQLTTGDAKLYFCRNEGDTSVAEPLSLDLFGNIRNWPEKFFGDMAGDIFAQNKEALKRKMANG